MKIEQIKMTPALATKLLQLNTRNRNLSQRRVAAYAAEMTAGNWLDDGAPIRIAVTGQLLDGQHRLAAIARAGRTIPLVVISDLDEGTQLVSDTGKPRSFADFLGIHGYPNNVALAAVTSMLWKWENGSLDYRGDWNKRPVANNHGLWELFQKRQTEIEIALKMAKQADRYVRMSRSVLAAGYVVFAGIEEEDADDFYAQLAHQVMQDTAAAVLERTMNNRSTAAQAKGLVDQSWQAVFLIKAWNAYRNDQKISILRWTRGGKNREEFPIPI